jgi:DNA replication and repair protein RecF
VHLAWLELTDFRSYPDLRFDPAPGINVLVGDNGTGKTTVLEAISYLSALRSFRGSPDAALIRAESPEAIVRGGFERESGELRVEIALPVAAPRRVMVNGKRPRRYSDVRSEVPVVAFLPDDLDLVKRGPAIRRAYLDDLAAMLSPSAGADQAEYDKALRQRNSLLRAEGRHVDPVELDVWDERVAEKGSEVLAHRLSLLDRLAPSLEAAYRDVGGGEALQATYASRWAGDDWRAASRRPADHAPALRAALLDRRTRDQEQRTTTAGPHRDEPGLVLGGRDVRTMASQGEQRTAVLALRLSAYRLLEERHGRPPLLLLDDVFSELDPLRAEGVMRLLPRGQVFVTSAREDDVPVAGTRWHVEGGVIRAG